MEEEINANTIQKEIEGNIDVGASSDSIESYFNERGLPITYDQYTNTYRSLIKKDGHGDEERKFTVKIILNERKQFQSIEVKESFTYL